MESAPPRLGGFQIKGSSSDEKFLVLSDDDGRQTRYRVTPEIIFQLAAHFPRYANHLASRLGVTDPGLGKNLHAKADAVEATQAAVDIDDSGTELVLSIDDALGTECSWCLTRELADRLGNALISKAAAMSTLERQEN